MERASRTFDPILSKAKLVGVHTLHPDVRDPYNAINTTLPVCLVGALDVFPYPFGVCVFIQRQWYMVYMVEVLRKMLGLRSDFAQSC